MKIEIVNATVQSWINDYKTNPKQRDVTLHARKALRGHLSSYSDAQACVSGAVFDGELYKLDGHTRAYLWSREELQQPKSVIVTTFHCNTLDQLLDLYGTFDNSAAAENSKDIFTGACRLHNFFPQSTLVKRGNLRRIFNIISGSRDIINQYDYVGYLLEAMRFADKLNISSMKFPTGAYAAILLTYLSAKSDQDRLTVEYFWQSILDENGLKTEQGMNGIQAAIEILDVGLIRRPDTTEHKVLCCKLLTCYWGYTTNKFFKKKSSVKPIHDLAHWMYVRVANYIELGVKYTPVDVKVTRSYIKRTQDTNMSNSQQL